MSGRTASSSRASSTAVTPSAVAYTSASVALVAVTVTERGPASAGSPVAGSIRWWSRRCGPKRRVSRPEVAMPPRDSSSVPSTCASSRGSAMSMRQCPPSGGLPHTAMSPPRSTSRSRQGRPGGAHRLQRARCGEALANPAEVDHGALFDARPPRVRVDVDARVGLPTVESFRHPLRELFEGAVVACRRERRQDCRVEPSMRDRAASPSGRECLDQAPVDRHPVAGSAVEPRQVAIWIEAGEDPLAGRHLCSGSGERATGEECIARFRGRGDGAARAHGAERPALELTRHTGTGARTFSADCAAPVEGADGVGRTGARRAPGRGIRMRA